jgi:macrolide transport system ATP-binding/permease protein
MLGLRHTVRLLLKSPGFTITAVLILGFGIGVNTAIFGLIEVILLKPLPYAHADQLVEVFQPLRNLQKFRLAYPDYLDFCANQHSFQGLALLYSDDLILTGQGDPAHLTVAFVTGNYFQTFGRPMLFGRSFGPNEDRPDAPSVVILGERLWRSRFRADPQVVGTQVILNGASYEIVGISPQRGDETANLYLPLNLEPNLGRLKTDRANHSFWCFGRLADGVTLQQAQADLEITSKSLAKRFPDTHSTITVRVVPLLDTVVGDFTSTLWLIGGAVGLLLVIACTNVAGLHLARGLERQKEMTILVSLLAGLFPALAVSKTDLSIRSEGAFGGTISRQRRRTQYGLIVCQVALASLLVFGCTLLARSFQNVQQVPLGFNPRNLLRTDIYLPDSKYGTSQECKSFFDSVIEKVGKLPGVKAVGTTDALPFSLDDNEGFAGPLAAVGQTEPDPGHKPRATLQLISSDYFRVLQIPLLQGREFDATDQLGRDHVVIVNQALADTYFPGQNPIGKQLHDYGEIVGSVRTNYTIVGVVPTIYQLNPARQYITAQTYFPFGQPNPYRQNGNECTLVVRTDGNPLSLPPSVQKVVASLDPDVPLSDSGTLDNLISRSFETRQVTLLVVTLFSVFALTLSVVGVYAILTRLVSMRTREIGIRVAIGAQVSDVIQIVFWQGVKIVSVGLTLGLIAALLFGQFLASFLFGITSYDPVTIALVIIVLALTACLACLVPTVRAIRINPVTALRE